MDREKAEGMQRLAAAMQGIGCGLTGMSCGCLMLVGFLLLVLMFL